MGWSASPSPRHAVASGMRNPSATSLSARRSAEHARNGRNGARHAGHHLGRVRTGWARGDSWRYRAFACCAVHVRANQGSQPERKIGRSGKMNLLLLRWTLNRPRSQRDFEFLGLKFRRLRRAYDSRALPQGTTARAFRQRWLPIVRHAFPTVEATVLPSHFRHPGQLHSIANALAPGIGLAVICNGTRSYRVRCVNRRGRCVDVKSRGVHGRKPNDERVQYATMGPFLERLADPISSSLT